MQWEGDLVLFKRIVELVGLDQRGLLGDTWLAPALFATLLLLSGKTLKVSNTEVPTPNACHPVLVAGVSGAWSEASDSVYSKKASSF